MKKINLITVIILFIYSLSITVNAQTVNTAPLPAGNTIIGGHLSVGNSNEIWTAATSLYFNYRGACTTTCFWNSGGATGKPIMTLLNNGSVGIGTISPNSTLDVNGSFRLNRPANLVDSYNAIGGDFILTPNPYSSTNNSYLKIGYPDNNTIRFGIDYDGHLGSAVWKNIQFGRYSTPYLTILDGGNVGIGLTNPTVMLDVAGTVRAYEVKVCLNQGCDFVFDKNYDLMSLHKLENYINLNKHLPAIAPAKEMESKGISVSELSAQLLRKVEELTLYVIEQQKRIEQLEKNQK